MKQPAHKSYVFDKGYRDVWATFVKTWKNTFKPVQKELDRLGDLFYDRKILAAIVAIIADLLVFGAVTLFTVALNTVISLILISLFLLAMPIVYTGFVLVWAADLLYRTVKRISSRCPNCQYKFPLPVYECGRCGRKHTKLVPGVYGIFKRKCLCGQKLPTTFFNGRHKLKASCPQCKYDVRDGGKHSDVCIPVVGGPSSGKTCFINMAISQLELVAEKQGLQFEYAFSSLNNYKSLIDGMRQHRALPDKTGDKRLQYYQFYLTPQGEKIKRLISLCDVAGEVYQDSGSMGGQIGYRYANAFVVVIDPLSIPTCREEVEKRYRISSFGASTEPIDEILSRLVSLLENMYAVSAKALLKTDVAIVFTKCDIPGLDEHLGKKAVAACMRSNKLSREEATNAVCERFLKNYGESNFLNNVKAKFKTVQFFTCSSLGYNQNSGQFEPDGVEDPILWLYRKIYG